MRTFPTEPEARPQEELMKFIADENLNDTAVSLLREAGYDVLSVSEVAPGIDDKEVLALAVCESRILLTFDKGFGNLIFERLLPPPPGIALFRIPDVKSEDVPHFVMGSTAAQTEWQGIFRVIYKQGNRSRFFPGR